jgi:hypothetical protein
LAMVSPKGQGWGVLPLHRVTAEASIRNTMWK